MQKRDYPLTMKRVVIMGAAGRDFHNFDVCFRDNPAYKVVAFTAAQIPFIEKRTYPPELSGESYPGGIPIYPEEELPGIIKRESVDEVVFSYSDVSHDYVMRRASLVTALGADFTLLGSEKTMLKSSLPVISVCAVRTGCGKSGVTRFIARLVKGRGRKVAAIRHPMPYGDLLKERVQRFSRIEDVINAGCTIEEMEEYEPLINSGVTVFSGVIYREILREAEKEAEVIVWDGGNNDLPFIKPDLEVVVTDPLRPGHEIGYYPGEANLRRAHIAVINKANSAKNENIDAVMKNIREVNPGASIIKTASNVTVEGEIKAGARALVIEDGPTLTHGGMEYGAGMVAARMSRAMPVDVRPHAVGSIKDTLEKYPRLKNLLPALGYSLGQMKELEETIMRTPCDIVIIATPVDLRRVIEIAKKTVRVSYEIEDMEEPGLKGAIEDFLRRVIG